ncbi:MAG: hypothetical protein KKD35_00705, partial [Elusimicrobia bacterium]|nr:hypothetical protein [Elusimicrobiota bacterium]
IPPKTGHPTISETYPLPSVAPEGYWRSIFENDYKFIWNSKGNHQLFNLKSDPKEKWNLAALEPERLKHMMSDLNRYIAKLPKPRLANTVKELDEDTKKALRSLGYVE